MIAIKTSYPPTPQQRHRDKPRKPGKKYTEKYDPSAEDKQNFLKSILQFKPPTPLEGPIVFQVAFWYKRPLTHFGTGRNAGILKERYRDEYMTSLPDGDNCYKFCSDAMEGVFFKNDKQIFFHEVGKYYANTPEDVGIHIIINEK